MSTYFLTGASGAVGSAIVPLLLADPATKLRILLRARTPAHLEERFQSLCEFWRIAPENADRRRIEPLPGDAALPQFGLSAVDYARVCEDTTHVIHCAASVRMNETLDEARASAIGSAREVLTLARALQARGLLSKVEFVSTVGIAGKRQGALPERWIDEAREFHNSYEQSKAEAEQLVRHAIDTEGLPVTVHRPSMVIGDSRGGRIIHFQIFYFIAEFMSGRKTFGLYPDFGEVRLDVIPVDWVARAIVDASRSPETAGSIFHLCSGPQRSPRLNELRPILRQAFRDHGHRLPPCFTVPHRLFAALPRIGALVAPPRMRRALSTLPIYLDYLADNQGFDNRVFVARLAERSLRLPDWGEYLPVVLSYYLKAKYGPRQSP